MPSDYACVLGINTSVYSGLDYLPSTYHRLLAHPGSFAVLGETAHEGVVSFALGHLLGCGQSLLMLAGRTKDGHQHRGVSLRILDTIRAHFASYTHPYTHEYTLSLGDAFLPHYETGLRRDIGCFLFPSTVPNGATRSVNLSNSFIKQPSVLSRDCFLNVIDHYRLGNEVNIWPNPMTVNWYPLDFHKGNIDWFDNDRSFNLVSEFQNNSNDFQGENIKNYCSVTNTYLDKQPKLLSLGSYWFCPTGMTYNIDFHWLGRVQDFAYLVDFSILEQHILCHMQRARQLPVRGDVCLAIYLDPRWPGLLDKVITFGTRLGVKPGPFRYQYVKRRQR